MKKFAFVNAAAERAFLDLPDDVRIQFSNDIRRVRIGMEPISKFKVLKGKWSGVVELIENGSPAFRTVYCAKYADTVFILHAFTKTTNGSDRKAMSTVEDRYKIMMNLVRAR